MEAHLLLADSAQRSPDGKVHALGLGWTVTSTPLPPQSVVVFIKVPWDQANEQHRASVTMLDEDGREVRPNGSDGPALAFHTEFETGRPAGVPKGFPLDVALTFTIAPGLPLAPGAYLWQLEIDGQQQETWRAAFQVRSPE